MNKTLLLSAVLATAFTIPAQATLAPSTWHDNSYEILLDANGNLTTNFTVGDILIGVVGITSYGPGANPDTMFTNAIFATQVLTVDPYTGGANYTPCNGGQPSLTSCSSFTFGAIDIANAGVGSVTSYDQAVAAAWGLFPSAGLAPSLINTLANTVATVWNAPQTVDTGNVIGTTLASVAAGGTQVATMGMSGGNYWTANGPSNILQGAALPASTGVGSYAFQITQTWDNYPLASYLPNALFTANGTIASAAGNGFTTFAINDQANISSTTNNVPEPSTLALIGIGLLVGFGASKRKRVDMAMYA